MVKVQVVLIPALCRPIQIETLDLKLPSVGAVFVRVAARNVCRSDFHLIAFSTCIWLDH
jgi:Zn-dependent alcohol dehydrogenase